MLPFAVEAAQLRKARAQATGRPDGKRPKIFSGAGEALSQVAAQVGLSRPTLMEALAVTAAGRVNPERDGDLVKKMDETGQVHGATIELRRRMEARNASPDGAPPPMERKRGSMRLDKDGEFQFKGNLSEDELNIRVRKFLDRQDLGFRIGRERTIVVGNVGKHTGFG
jgi:hypothetical protein